MCGIAGFVGRGNKEALEHMISAIKYRGPDYTGVSLQGDVGLAHARLSIIDTSPLGNQPMFSEDKSVAVVFNGEIYNFRDLRTGLEERGCTFHSHSDTEVILWLYKQYGETCFEKLSGMFAIALYDFREKKLLLARDRMGEKPLYFAHVGNTFLFASEPKALLASGLLQKELDLSALRQYLLHDYVPTPLSIFKNIHKLEPATVLTYKNGTVEKEAFWQQPTGPREPMSEREALVRLDTLLAKTVSRELVSDVPLGVFLSGGLDSSTMCYYATQAKQHDVHTFSIGFDEPSFDESTYAFQVSKHLGTIHHHRVVGAQDAIAAIPDIFKKLDEPLADASIIPTFLLSRFARESVTVALGGDGSDELFAGYPTFQAEKFYASYRHVPFAASALQMVAGALPTSHADFSLRFKLQKFLEGFGEKDLFHRHARWLGSFSDNECLTLLTPEVRDAVLRERSLERQPAAGEEGDLNDLLTFYQRTYLMDQLLVKVDRASMFNALETRAPFLDHEVVAFANSLPYSMKLHGWTTKYILKKLMQDKLPSEIVFRKKKGFGMPVAAWLLGPLREWAEELLVGKGIREDGVFNSRVVGRLWQEHLSGHADHRKKLWNLLAFQAWKQEFLR